MICNDSSFRFPYSRSLQALRHLLKVAGSTTDDSVPLNLAIEVSKGIHRNTNDYSVQLNLVIEAIIGIVGNSTVDSVPLNLAIEVSKRISGNTTDDCVQLKLAIKVRKGIVGNTPDDSVPPKSSLHGAYASSKLIPLVTSCFRMLSQSSQRKLRVDVASRGS